jgi:hypothetical protein
VVRLRIVRSRWFVGPSSAESAAAAAPLSWERRGLCAVRAPAGRRGISPSGHVTPARIRGTSSRTAVDLDDRAAA